MGPPHIICQISAEAIDRVPSFIIELLYFFAALVLGIFFPKFDREDVGGRMLEISDCCWDCWPACDTCWRLDGA